MLSTVAAIKRITIPLSSLDNFHDRKALNPNISCDVRLKTSTLLFCNDGYILSFDSQKLLASQSGQQSSSSTKTLRMNNMMVSSGEMMMSTNTTGLQDFNQ